MATLHQATASFAVTLDRIGHPEVKKFMTVEFITDLLWAKYHATHFARTEKAHVLRDVTNLLKVRRSVDATNNYVHPDVNVVAHDVAVTLSSLLNLGASKLCCIAFHLTLLSLTAMRASLFSLSSSVAGQRNPLVDDLTDKEEKERIPWTLFRRHFQPTLDDANGAESRISRCLVYQIEALQQENARLTREATEKDAWIAHANELLTKYKNVIILIEQQLPAVPGAHTNPIVDEWNTGGN